ncbi:MAG: serine acetyltransferase [Kamptonema sp. SIO1D9]|nr:serine acetyltransferase [Kamptonema sp. SIO1D9]
MLENLRADIDRYVYTDNTPWLMVVLTRQAVWATAQYRFSRWVHYHVHIPGIRLILKILSAIWRKIIEFISGIELPNRSEIGKGLFIPHPYNIIVGGAKLGEYCTISQDVTIGIGGRGDKQGFPKIGDRAYIGAGARIIGSITIGNDVAIGANAVVTKDLPDNAVAVGVPAKIINYKGSKDFIFYREQESEEVTELVNEVQEQN